MRLRKPKAPGNGTRRGVIRPAGGSLPSYERHSIVSQSLPIVGLSTFMARGGIFSIDFRISSCTEKSPML
jgi:hypothetical protein